MRHSPISIMAAVHGAKGHMYTCVVMTLGMEVGLGLGLWLGLGLGLGLGHPDPSPEPGLRGDNVGDGGVV